MTKSKLAKAAEEFHDILTTGKVLAIDPSSGSRNSVPGYCLIDRCEWIESGTIDIPYRKALPQRLKFLADVLTSEFRDIDLLIIEDLPPYMQNAGGSFRTKATINLHRSVGAIFGVLGNVPVIEVAPVSWKAQERKLPFAYVKGDEADALMLALTTYQHAKITCDGLLERIREVCAE